MIGLIISFSVYLIGFYWVFKVSAGRYRMVNYLRRLSLFDFVCIVLWPAVFLAGLVGVLWRAIK